jgi:hypothetical protein
MRAYVGVTDGQWYRFPSARPDLTEINFWRPGGHYAFRALQPGEPFFFKSHYPHNRVVAAASSAVSSPRGYRTPGSCWVRGTAPAA